MSHCPKKLINMVHWIVKIINYALGMHIQMQFEKLTIIQSMLQPF